MPKETYSKEDRALILALRNEGRAWPEVATEASKRIGRTLTAESVRFQYRKAKGTDPIRPRRSNSRPTKKRGHSLDEFRNQFDVAQKIRDKVEELLQGGGEEFWTDDEFRQLAGVSVQNWRRHAELDEFKQYQFRKPGFHAWAPPSIVEEMKEITGHAGH